MLTLKEEFVAAIEREGYQVGFAQSVSRQSRTAMIKLYFTREDNKAVSFITDWGIFTSIGDQFGFYTVPITEIDEQTDAAILIYLNRKRLSEVHDELCDLHKRLNSSYWVVQEYTVAYVIADLLKRDIQTLEKYMKLLERLSVNDGKALTELAQLAQGKGANRRNLIGELYELLNDLSVRNKQIVESGLFAREDEMSRIILDF